MRKTTYTYFRFGKAVTFFLSAVLIVSVFTVLVPVSLSRANLMTTSAIQKLTTSVVESLKDTASERMNIIVHTTDNLEVMAKIEELGGQTSQVYKSVNALAASIPASRLLELASDVHVNRVYDDPLRRISYSTTGNTEGKANIPLDPLTNEPVFKTELSEAKVEPIAITDLKAASPSIYTNAYLTHADAVWNQTGYGSNSLVVIIDTGVWSASPMLVGNVIGGVDISSDVGSSYEGYNSTTNHYHGTACAHLLAAHATIRFQRGSGWGEAILRYNPEGSFRDADGRVNVTCMGIAPGAQIYAIKVFDYTGGSTPTSTIMKGMDIAIQMKLNGTMDVDVISMSLGGGVGADGEDPEDLLVDVATQAGITVVTAAGNEGPAPLKVGSPGSAKTAIAVGAAMDPIHEHVLGDIYFWADGEVPGNGLGEIEWYPHNEKAIVDFSSRGPAADGRLKPEVVATGSWCFIGVFPDGYARIGSGTSFACPQVAGEAALLNSYAEEHSLRIGPLQIKQAIIDGAEPIPGFTAMEQGAGYIDAEKSLDVIKSNRFGYTPQPRPSHFGDIWYPPIEVRNFDRSGRTILYNLTLEPTKYKYFDFRVSSQIDSIKVTLSNIQLAPVQQRNPAFDDLGVIYMSTPERGGIDAYYFWEYYFNKDGKILVMSNGPFQPGVVRLVLACDFSAFNPVTVGELTIEVTQVSVSNLNAYVTMSNYGVPAQAQVSVYSGRIEKFYGSITQGEEDVYSFNIPDTNGHAYVFLSWYRDWAHWATSDLDLIIIEPWGGLNIDGATGASPEAATISGAGDYTLLIDGYQVYFGKTENYCLEIVYFADSTPLWTSSTFKLNSYARIRSPTSGLAVVWLHDLDFDRWYIAGFTQLTWRSGGYAESRAASAQTKHYPLLSFSRN